MKERGRQAGRKERKKSEWMVGGWLAGWIG